MTRVAAKRAVVAGVAAVSLWGVPASGQISITPKGGSVTAPANATGQTVIFGIENLSASEEEETVLLTCAHSGSATSCSAPGSIDVPGGGGPLAYREVTVTFSTGAAGTGQVWLQGMTQISGHEDAGWYDVTATGGSPSDTAAVVVSGPAPKVIDGANVPSSQDFTVTNLGNATATFSIQALCAGAATGCIASAPSLQLAAGASGIVNVSFSSGGEPIEGALSGSIGTVSVIARHTTDGVEHAGFMYLIERASGSMRVVVDGTNPGESIARDQCVIVGPVKDAAWECWDLRIVHPLPSTRTLNQDRTPVLTYNSQHAHPHPAIVAAVQLPTTAGVTDSVKATLTVNGGVRAGPQKWPGSLFPAGGTRLITLAYDAFNDSTGLYPYTLEVVRYYQSGSAQEVATADGEVAFVNRKNSPFGAGWWLAGLEQLVPHPTRKLWIGGDGSTRAYMLNPVTGKWGAKSITHPDTLKAEAGGVFSRLLPGGDTVRFDATGRHVATRNRLGHQASFTYIGAGLNAPLDSISLPVPAGAPSRAYHFSYAGATLYAISAPPTTTGVVLVTRVTSLQIQSTGQLTRINVPGGAHFIQFAYDPSFTHRMTERIDRRGVRSTFAYDVAGKLAEVTLFKFQ